MELGQIFWLIFYPVEDYLDDLLDSGATWDHDYTWDKIIDLQVHPPLEDFEGIVGGFINNPNLVPKKATG